MFPDTDNRFKPEEKSVSILGIFSLLIAILAGTLIFALIAVTTYLEFQNPSGINDDSPILGFIGVGAIIAIILHLIGATLGFAGLFQNNKKKLFSVVGSFLNLFIMLSLIGLIVFGLLTE